MRAVEIVAFPQVQVLDVTGPLQIFASANEFAERANGVTPYAMRIVASAASIVSSAGLELRADALSRLDEPVDTLIVSGGQGVHAAGADTNLVGWLAARALHARRVVSVCTGAFLLGAAGLLHGKRVVTHWQDCADLARRFPATRVESDPIFVRDGSLWTSAGVTAGIDLALALVEMDLGHAIAIAVARDLVVFLKRPGGQAQFSATLALQERGVEFDRLHGWMIGHLVDDLSIPALAAKAGLSERGFARRYRAATGVTPARAVEKMRVEMARTLLSTSPLSIKRVASRCGFGTEETMRRSFLRQIATTPNDYRSRFAEAGLTDKGVSS